MTDFSPANLKVIESFDFNVPDVIALYKANKWSSAEKPEHLIAGLKHSHSLVLAFHGEQLIGLGNAISDGYLVVYYPHLLVDPRYHRRGVGKRIMDRLQAKYSHFHQQVLIADGKAVDFYLNCGFKAAGTTQSMWIYRGGDH